MITGADVSYPVHTGVRHIGPIFVSQSFEYARAYSLIPHRGGIGDLSTVETNNQTILLTDVEK